MLDHLALRLRLPKHEPQPLELKPEPPKLKSPGAETFSLRSPGAKAIGAEAFDPGTEASGAKATTSSGTHARSVDEPLTGSFCYSWLLLGRSWPVLGRSWPLLAAPGRSWAALGVRGPLLAVPGPLLGRSWALLGRS